MSVSSAVPPGRQGAERHGIARRSWAVTRDLIGADVAAMREGRPAGPATILLRLGVHARWRAVLAFRIAGFLIDTPLGKPVALWLTDRTLAGSGAELQPTSRIGGGLVLKHTTGLVIGGDVRAGERLTLHQGVTLGDRHPYGGQPRIGDDVIVGVGASILGPITVGDRSTVAAGAVCLDDVPDDCVVAGVPARVVRRVAAAGPDRLAQAPEEER